MLNNNNNNNNNGDDGNKAMKYAALISVST